MCVTHSDSFKNCRGHRFSETCIQPWWGKGMSWSRPQHDSDAKSPQGWNCHCDKNLVLFDLQFSLKNIIGIMKEILWIVLDRWASQEHHTALWRTKLKELRQVVKPRCTVQLLISPDLNLVLGFLICLFQRCPSTPIFLPAFTYVCLKIVKYNLCYYREQFSLIFTPYLDTSWGMGAN